MKSKLMASFIILLVLSIASLPMAYTVYGQTATMKLSTKGSVAESSNFHDAIMWTIINGDKGTIIIQSPAGRGMAHVSISSSTNCSSTTSTCLMSTVTDVGQIDAFKVGDTARFSIDTTSKQETVSMLTGTLAGFDVTINLSKTWGTNIISVTPAVSTNSTTTTPVIPSQTPVNSTSTNSTETQTSPKHLSTDLSESFKMTPH